MDKWFSKLKSFQMVSWTVQLFYSVNKHLALCSNTSINELEKLTKQKGFLEVILK